MKGRAAAQVVLRSLHIARRDLAAADRPREVVVAVDERRGREHRHRPLEVGVLGPGGSRRQSYGEQERKRTSHGGLMVQV